VDRLRKILRGLYQPCQPHSGSVIAAGLRVAHKISPPAGRGRRCDEV
jgi:hypothetical protein